MSHLHDVPMFRQRIEAAEWDQHGGSTLGDRAEWSDRACGMACLKMILAAYGHTPHSMTELVLIGVERDALTDRGWLHAGIADMASDFGVLGRAEPVPVDELTTRLKDGPLIISISEQFPTDGRKGGHLVIARGFEDGEDPQILIRDPSAWGQTHDRVPLSRLAASYTGRAISFPPLAPASRIIAVLGEMAELGDASVDAHREVGQMAAEHGVDLVVAVGDVLAKQLALAASAAGVPEVAIVGDNETAAAYVESVLRPGDKVLCKASRSGMLWQVAQALTSKPITGL